MDKFELPSHSPILKRQNAMILKKNPKEKKMESEQPIDPPLRYHKSPYYFNAGELFVSVIINALTFTIALSLSTGVVATIKAVGTGTDDVGTAWIAFVIVFFSALLLIIILCHAKKQFMRMAYRSPLTHAPHYRNEPNI